MNADTLETISEALKLIATSMRNSEEERVHLARFALSWDVAIDDLIKQAASLGIQVKRSEQGLHFREAVELIAAKPIKSDGEQSEL